MLIKGKLYDPYLFKKSSLELEKELELMKGRVFEARI